MKTAYELAMERLAKSSPSRALTSEQKRELAELDSLYRARIAEQELALRADLDKAEAAGEEETAEKLRQRLAQTIQRLRDELEQKKEQVRQSGAAAGSAAG